MVNIICSLKEWLWGLKWFLFMLFLYQDIQKRKCMKKLDGNLIIKLYKI